MAGCYPRECDHHCARVCGQYVCICDYHPGYTVSPDDQRLCCKWELMYRPKSDPYAYTDEEARVDTLTRYFGIDRSLRDPHDPIRFTGINHVPLWLHADHTTLDMNYANILKEREITAASRYFGPIKYYSHRSIRPYIGNNDKPSKNETIKESRLPSSLNKKDEEELRRGILRGRISAQGLRLGQMPYLD